MPVYSHSQLGVYEECPLKYKLRYLDKIERDEVEGVEAFLGNMVHETLKKCYDDLKFTKLNSLDDLLAHYNKLWQENWRDSIVITRQGLTPEHYRSLGEKLIGNYYKRYAPFDSDITIGTEMRIQFSLDDNDRYKMRGFIDRLSRSADGVYEIHDYKTSAYLPAQREADNDRQLALYQVGVLKRWHDIKDIRLIWHYLAFDAELVSCRKPEAISKLAQDTMKLIDEIESTEEFLPRESGLCEWCEYPDLCPRRKHFYKVEALPANEYLKEPGVVLVNKYAELREKAAELDAEMDKVKEAILGYARKEGVDVIKGSSRKVRVKFDRKLKFPGKNDEQREELDSIIIDAGKWMDVSQLDTTALVHAIEDRLWNKQLIERVLKFGRLEESGTVYLSRLRDAEK